MDKREARIMNVRQFRAEMPDERVIVLSKGVIKGSWTPGTEGISPETLAQVMGLITTLTGGTLDNSGQKPVLDAIATSGSKVSGPGGSFGAPAPAPKPPKSSK